MNKTLTSIVCASLLGLTACTKAPENFIEGEVLETYGTLSRLEESSGALFGNESVKLGNPSYGMIVKTTQGVYNIQLDAFDDGGTPGPHTIYNMAGAIKKGTKIRFPTKAYGTNTANQPMGFSNDRVGVLDPDEVQIKEQ